MSRPDHEKASTALVVDGGLSHSSECTFPHTPDLSSNSIGPRVVGRAGCWSLWRGDNDIVGVLVRGTVEASDAERLASALADTLAPSERPIRLVIDALELEDAGCGVVAAEILWNASRELVKRHRFAGIGMAHRVGASGALVAGWTRLLRGAGPSLVSPHIEDVLDLLALRPLAQYCRELRESSRDELDARLAQILKERPRARLAEIADHLGVAPRRLRAHFAARETTFREESLRRRLDIAREALAEAGAKLDSVAYESGFNSGSHLATAMRHLDSACPWAPKVDETRTTTAPAISNLAPERPRLVDLAHFVRSPIGSCHLRRSWLIWFADPGLAMCSVFGPMGEQDLFDLFAAIDGVMNAAPAPIDVLSDATLGQIKDVGTAGMDLLYRYTSEHKERLARTIRHHAITATDTPSGAFLGGLGEVNEARHPWRVMRSVEDGLRWFGRSDGVAIARMLSELIKSAREGGALLPEIEMRLQCSPRLTVAEIARAIGMSVRALQRDCNTQGTSFRELQRRVLIDRARELLANTDFKIEAIVRQLGLRSRSHFVSMFRQETGTTPSQYRDASKSAPGAE